jgi:alkylation response protein AidB-like acyl-CoA dehydrogenase
MLLQTVGAPPIRQYASQELQGKILPEIISGRKRISLAITEPSAGSDVRNITTTAEKTADGKHYIVNGEKKWITNGMFSDYFSTAVRTGGPGAEGLSFLLIDRHLPGISCRKIEIGAGKLSATTYITFEDVKVPAEMLMGKEGGGFKFILSNFLHERIWIVFQALRGARTCLEDAFQWAMKREVFGQKLIEQPVVRHKLGLCGKKVDALQAWTEQIVYEIDNMSEEEGNKQLAGTTALLKVEAGMVAKYVADECVKIMGGLGLTKTGQGARIEAISRGVIGLIVPGGSEDVMIDLGVREALKLSKARAAAASKL